MVRTIGFVSILALSIVTRSAMAQKLSIELREAGSGTPIAGAVIALVADSNPRQNALAQALTNERGRATLIAPSPGSYALLIRRIGYQRLTKHAVTVRQDEITNLELSMDPIRAVLSAVSTRAESDCRFESTDGTLAALLWENIRTALWATLLTADQWQIPLEITLFRREVSLSGAPGRTVRTSSVVRQKLPFGAIAPETLATRGFIFQTKGGTTFAAPDAVLLLSPQFVNTHCFQAVTGRDTSLVGLHFEPTRQRTLPDVSGTLWVDRTTIELRYLDYLYTGLGGYLGDARLGGRLEFQRLASGAWIVDEWYVRMPRTGALPQEAGWRGVEQSVRLIGYVDDGGTAAIATIADEGPRYAFLEGTVFDSTTMATLPQAVVRLAGSVDSVVTDSVGKFQIRSDSGGLHTFVATHPKLILFADSLMSDVSLSVGDTARVVIAGPSPRTFARELCGEATQTAILGRAMRADGTPLENVPIRFSEYPIGRHPETEALSGPHGMFVWCQPTIERPLAARMSAVDRPTSTTDWVIVGREIVVHEGEVRWLELLRPARPR